MTELLKARESCHFCEILYSRIRDLDGIMPHELVVCHLSGSLSEGSLRIEYSRKGDSKDEFLLVVAFTTFARSLFFNRFSLRG